MTQRAPVLIPFLMFLLFSVALQAGAATAGSALPLAGLEALGPRLEGSEALAKSFVLLSEGFRSAGLKPEAFTCTEIKGEYSRAPNLELDLPGLGPDRLYVLVPVDSYAGEDAARGCGGIRLAYGAALGLAARVQAQGPLPIGLSFVFLGEEHRYRRGEDNSGGLGARTVIKRGESEARRAFLYLEVDGLGQGFSVINTTKGHLSPYWLFENCLEALKAAGLSSSFAPNSMQAYRLGLGDRIGSLGPLLAGGLPAVELRDSSPPDPEALPRIEAFAHFLLALAQDNAEGFPDTWDKNYLSFQLGTKALVLREPVYVGLLIAFAGVFILIALGLSISHRGLTKAFLARWPRILGQGAVFVLLALVVFLAAKAVAGLGSRFFASPSYWRAAPGLFLLVRLGSAFLCFLAALLVLVEARVLSANPRFYEASALGVLSAAFLVFSAVQLPLVFYFAWAMVFVALSLFLHRPWATLIAFVGMDTPIFLLGASLLASGESSLLGAVIAPNLAQTLLLSVAFLPFFVFAGSPLLALGPKTRRGRLGAALLLLCLALGLEGGAVLRRQSLGSLSPGPLEVSEVLDQAQGRFAATIVSEDGLGKLRVGRNTQVYALEGHRNQVSISGPDPRVFVSLRASHQDFLGRRLYSLDFSFTKAPYSLKLLLRSPKEIVCYDSSLPLDFSLDGRTATLVPGINPPRDLALQLTVPPDFSGELFLEALYLEPLASWEAPPDRSLVVHSQSLTAAWALTGQGGP